MSRVVHHGFCIYVNSHDWCPGLSVSEYLKCPLDLLLDDCLNFSCGTCGFLRDLYVRIRLPVL